MSDKLIRSAIVSTLALSSTCAVACDMVSRRVEYGGTGCLSGRCINVSQKWRFIGDKILHYPDPRNNEGIVWRRNAVVDMIADPANTRFEPSARLSQRETATLTSQDDGSDFILTRHNQLLSTITNRVIANTWMRIVIRISDCNSCELRTYEISGDYNGYPHKSTFSDNWCRVETE